MIGKRLRQLRKEHNISCRQLGKDIGLSASALSHYETGINVPCMKNVVKIAEYFNVSVDYLVERSEYRNQEEIQKTVQKGAARKYINKLIDNDIVEKRVVSQQPAEPGKENKPIV